MSVAYIIAPPGESTWTLDVDRFQAALRTKWPTIQIESGAPPFAPMVWETRGDSGHRLVGRVAPALDAVWLEGELYDCARFAVWFRTQVVESQPLVFADEMGSEIVPLDARTTAEDLAKPFRA